MIDSILASLLTFYSSEDSLDTHHELFHRERFSDIVVGTNLETFEDIFLQCLCGEEDDWQLSILLANILCERETILLRHHHVEHADIKLCLLEFSVTSFAIRTKHSLIALSLKIFTEQHAEVLIILAQQDFQILFHSCIFYLLIISLFNSFLFGFLYLISFI